MPKKVTQIFDGKEARPALHSQLSDQAIADVLASILREWE